MRRRVLGLGCFCLLACGGKASDEGSGGDDAADTQTGTDGSGSESGDGSGDGSGSGPKLDVGHSPDTGDEPGGPWDDCEAGCEPGLLQLETDEGTKCVCVERCPGGNPDAECANVDALADPSCVGGSDPICVLQCNGDSDCPAGMICTDLNPNPPLSGCATQACPICMFGG